MAKGASNLAKTVPETFHGLVLDPFQRKAIDAIDQGWSVLVSAPTGTGKTLIADYVVEMCARAGKRVVYTAPIKALSNQKFSDYCDLLGPDQVGIVTGDVSIRPDAPLCIMTTEILRNQLVSRDTTAQDLSWVIFDEIHYIASDRGIAWEESIILLPKDVRVLGLSATISNLDALATWMEETSGSPVVRVTESRRAVPLVVRYVTPDGLNTFGRAKEGQSSGRWQGQRCDHLEILGHMLADNALPALFFIFSRAGTEERARQAAARHQLLDTAGQAAMERALEEMRERYPVPELGSGRLLGQCLRRGVGFHHAGLLPATKHVIESLYGQGLIRLLYCTETFAVGVNFPVRSVAMEGARKFDGTHFRSLTAGEFQQMTGRAGRRGKDEVGYAFIGFDDRERDPLVNYPRMPLEPVDSQFFVTESTALNLLEAFGREQALEVLARNFREFQRRQKREEQQQRLAALREERDAFWQLGCPHLGTAACPLERRRLLHLEADYRKKRRHRRDKRGRRSIDGHLLEVRAQLEVREDCPKESPDPCRPLVGPFAKLQERIGQAERALAENATQAYYRHEMERALVLLERLGYVEGDHLLPRGQVARKLYVMPLLLTELIFEGFFASEPEHVINAVLAGIDYDARRDDACFGLPHVGATRTVERLARRLAAQGAEVRFDAVICPWVLAWSQGVSFTELMRHTSIQDGDCIGAVRRAIDLLRQLRHVTAEDPVLTARLARASRLLDRDEARVVF